jgi:hypothetical protein
MVSSHMDMERKVPNNRLWSRVNTPHYSCPDTWTRGHPDTQYAHMDTPIRGHMDTPTRVCRRTPTRGHMDTPTRGHMDTPTRGHMTPDTWPP